MDDMCCEQWRLIAATVKVCLNTVHYLPLSPKSESKLKLPALGKLS